MQLYIENCTNFNRSLDQNFGKWLDLKNFSNAGALLEECSSVDYVQDGHIFVKKVNNQPNPTPYMKGWVSAHAIMQIWGLSLKTSIPFEVLWWLYWFHVSLKNLSMYQDEYYIGNFSNYQEIGKLWAERNKVYPKYNDYEDYARCILDDVVNCPFIKIVGGPSDRLYLYHKVDCD